MVLQVFTLTLTLTLTLALTVAAWAGQTTKPSTTSAIQKRFVGSYSIASTFANLHQHPSPFSPTLQTLACGEGVKLYDIIGGAAIPTDWGHIESDAAEGFIQKTILSPGLNREVCFQNKYPKFFNILNLDPREIYYWGKLDQFLIEKTKVK
jgi:hypothetical protein